MTGLTGVKVMLVRRLEINDTLVEYPHSPVRLVNLSSYSVSPSKWIRKNPMRLTDHAVLLYIEHARM
jgi:hypothetical protein